MVKQAVIVIAGANIGDLSCLCYKQLLEGIISAIWIIRRLRYQFQVLLQALFELGFHNITHGPAFLKGLISVKCRELFFQLFNFLRCGDGILCHAVQQFLHPVPGSSQPVGNHGPFLKLVLFNRFPVQVLQCHIHKGIIFLEELREV